nr:MAG TPA: hypothetical protein [Caudoviricetes sp.]DAT83849.1 MAG TPA: hypothetical protein [Caudoviricetes sp.]
MPSIINFLLCFPLFYNIYLFSATFFSRYPNLPGAVPASWLLMCLHHRQRLPCSSLHHSPQSLFRHK